MPPKKKPIKTQRYWPGKGPVEVEDSSSDEGLEYKNIIQKDELVQTISTHIAEPAKLKIGDLKLVDKKLTLKSSDESSDDAEVLQRKELLKLAILKQKSQGDKNDKTKFEDNEFENTVNENESEFTGSSETESEEEDKLFKPVFIPKQQRQTIIEKEQLAREYKEKEKQKMLDKEIRKLQSQQLLQKQKQKEIDDANAEANEYNKIDDIDDPSNEADFESWKLRELKRIKRDREEREFIEKEQEELENRRNMTEKERLELDFKKVEQQQDDKEKKGNPLFMQKYYHKGAFYMDDDEEIFKRDFTQPRPDEIIHKEFLPKLLQTREFGKASKTKWTHLVNEDTTKDTPWSQSSNVTDKLLRKMGGLHDSNSNRLHGAKRPKKEK